MGNAMETSPVETGTRDRLRGPHLASRDLVTHVRGRDTARATAVGNTRANSSGPATARDLRQVSVADALVRAAVRDDRDKGAGRSTGDSTPVPPCSPKARSPI